MAKQVAETIQAAGRVDAVFGQPVRLGRSTIVPVAVVQASVGGGGGGLPLLSGGGGGFNLQVVPVGYLVNLGGEPVFKAIRPPLEALRLGREARPADAEAVPLLSRIQAALQGAATAGGRRALSRRRPTPRGPKSRKSRARAPRRGPA
jgi:hypothetical protein